MSWSYLYQEFRVQNVLGHWKCWLTMTEPILLYLRGLKNKIRNVRTKFFLTIVFSLRFSFVIFRTCLSFGWDFFTLWLIARLVIWISRCILHCSIFLQQLMSCHLFFIIAIISRNVIAIVINLVERVFLYMWTVSLSDAYVCLHQIELIKCYKTLHNCHLFFSCQNSTRGIERFYFPWRWCHDDWLVNVIDNAPHKVLTAKFSITYLLSCILSDCKVANASVISAEVDESLSLIKEKLLIELISL